MRLHVVENGVIPSAEFQSIQTTFLVLPHRGISRRCPQKSAFMLYEGRSSLWAVSGNYVLFHYLIGWKIELYIMLMKDLILYLC